MSGTYERVLRGEDLVAWRRFRVVWPESLREPEMSNARKALSWDTPPTDLFEQWKALLEAGVRDTIGQATTAMDKKEVETIINDCIISQGNPGEAIPGGSSARFS